MAKKLTTEDFIAKSRAIHGDRYDYSKVEYTLASTKVEIICGDHGSFMQQPTKHINSGQGCPKCASNGRRVGKEKFIEKAKAFHGDIYDYSKVVYINSTTDVDIICPIHGIFQQSPPSHLKGGCNSCAIERVAKKLSYTTDQFIEKAKEVHGDKYDYTNTVYTNSAKYVDISCNLHNSFKQLAGAHLAGYGCPTCGRSKGIINKTRTTDQFVERAIEVHGDRYNYSLVEYVSSTVKVDILCEKNSHGVFSQAPDKHLQGNGCPKCGLQMSKAEDTIIDHIKSIGLIAEQSDRTVIKPLELDIVIPDKKIAIEYNGIRWHSEKFGKDKHYHKNKTDLCKSQGYRLIHIWEDDFLKNPERELNFLTHVLGCSDHKKTYARKTILKEIDSKVAKDFLEQYHIQGSVNSSVYVGALYNDELVTVTSFTYKNNKSYAELTRHVTSGQVVGSLGKATKYFSNKYKLDIISFCDLSRFDGVSYLSAGFKEIDVIAPDYRYVTNNQREHKFGWRKSGIKRKLPEIYSEELTEKEMMDLADIPRIWDCGKIKFEYKYK